MILLHQLKTSLLMVNLLMKIWYVLIVPIHLFLVLENKSFLHKKDSPTNPSDVLIVSKPRETA